MTRETRRTGSFGELFSADAAQFLAALQPEALSAPESGIVEVFNYGRGRKGLIPLWVGEGDVPTPAFISSAARRSFEAGETFYTAQRGLPELREAIARYMAKHYETPFAATRPAFTPDRFFVTMGGMHAIQLAVRLVATKGDDILVPTPAWPNFAGALAVSGAHPLEVPLVLSRRAGALRWQLDPDRLAAAITPTTRAIIVNSPANPTGWTATRDELLSILALARRSGAWIIADEIYGRICFSAERAASFHDIIDEFDKVLFVQTLSKNFAMTGWRIGWLEAPPVLGQVIENLIQYSSSGAPVPVQRAAIAALDHGGPFLTTQIERMRGNRDTLCEALAATGRVRFARPEATFYLFCAIDGVDDSRAAALRLVDEANVGVAPGSAFGPGGESFMRLCYARDPAQIAEAAERLSVWLKS